MPDTGSFVALARSSPWRWRTLRLVVTWTPDAQRAPVRAWVDRPYGLRVEDLDGRLLESSWRDPSPSVMRFAMGTPGGGVRVEHVHPLQSGAPDLRADGLVGRRPRGGRHRLRRPHAPDYRWVAMLDPVELADGSPAAGADDPGPEGWGRQPGLPPVEVLRPVVEVDHGGRRAWQAVLRDTAHYDPRCTCCPLLDGERAARLDAEAGGWAVRDRRWPSSWRVRLDVGTGVVVELTELGGDRHGAGFRADVEEVDANLPRALSPVVHPLG